MKWKELSPTNKRNYIINILIMIALIFIAINIVFFTQLKSLNANLDEIIEENENLKEQYNREVTELTQRVNLLSDRVVIENANQEERDAKAMPVGIPVSGQVDLLTDPTESEKQMAENNSVENDPLAQLDFESQRLNPYTVEFELQRDSRIIASGDGTVVFVGEDDLYGHIVKVDHGNGYISIYRYSEEPKINQGDSVLKGQMIYEVTNNKGVLAYHITYENTYLNPFQLIEIQG